MSDLEKIKNFLTYYFDLYTETYEREKEIELAVYYWNDYLGSVYFTLDGSLTEKIEQTEEE